MSLFQLLLNYLLKFVVKTCPAFLGYRLKVIRNIELSFITPLSHSILYSLVTVRGLAYNQVIVRLLIISWYNVFPARSCVNTLLNLKSTLFLSSKILTYIFYFLVLSSLSPNLQKRTGLKQKK